MYIPVPDVDWDLSNDSAELGSCGSCAGAEGRSGGSFDDEEEEEEEAWGISTGGRGDVGGGRGAVVCSVRAVMRVRVLGASTVCQLGPVLRGRR